MSNDKGDFTKRLQDWLATQFDPREVTCGAAGLCIGIALSARHSEYAKAMYVEITEDYKYRISAGSPLFYEVASIAAGEHRTGPEQVADELVAALPLP